MSATDACPFCSSSDWLNVTDWPCRYHIGESLIPSVRHYLRFIDAEEKVASYGFARKVPNPAQDETRLLITWYLSPAQPSNSTSICARVVSATLSVVLPPLLTSIHTDTDFVALGASNNAWNVTRSEFDQLLLEHAKTCGVKVFTETRADTLQFADELTPKPSRRASSADRHVTTTPPLSEASSSRRRIDSGFSEATGIEFGTMGRPVKASYSTDSGAKGTISFDYLVDASGRNGLLSTRCAQAQSFPPYMRRSRALEGI